MACSNGPFSELFGWAVRVQMSFSVIRKTENGNYMLQVICEPMSNEIDPISNYLKPDDGSNFMSEAGEDEKCREAFAELTHKLIKSRYLAQ